MPPPRKPPQVVRKSTESSVERFVSNVSSGKASPLQYGIVAAVAVAMLAVAGGIHLLMRSQMRLLTPDATEALKEAFYSGEPWLVECTKPKASKASPVVYDAEGSLKGFKFGMLNCGAVLPSGKTTYERFKLREPSYGPVVLAMANGAVPQIAPRNVLSNGAELAKWATSVTPPKVFAPTTSEQFESQCLRKAWCVVVLSPTGRLVDAERAALQQLAARERRVRVVKLDESKTTLLLDLPGGVPPPTAKEATVLLLKQLPKPAGSAKPADGDDDGAESDDEGDGAPPIAAAKLSGGLADLSGSFAAIGGALKASAEVPSDFHKLVKRPSLRPKRMPTPPATPRATSSSTPSPADPPTKTLTDAELKAMRAEREKLIKEAEQQRRQKMAQEEASANNIVEETDTVDGGSVLEEADDSGGAAEEAEEAEEVEAEEFE